MKKFIRSFSALTLCVLCLISMIAPIFAATCSRCSAELPAIVCNDWYNYIHEYHNESSVWCYGTWNARCEQTCTECSQNHFVDHWHGGSRTQHDFYIEVAQGDTYRVCSRSGCYYSYRLSG